MQQDSSSIFMVRPKNFAYNEQTALSNTFQNANTAIEDLQRKVEKEFDTAVQQLRQVGIDVWVIEDTADIVKPDAIFPNNWISTHEDGTIVLYPMLTPNRRAERRMDLVAILKEQYEVSRIIDLSPHEQHNEFLEGTGSIVFDHAAATAYACLSPRTDLSVLEKLCSEIGYRPISFRSVDENNVEVYHTNVIMGIGKEYAVICLESIKNEHERQTVETELRKANKEIIDISFEQVKAFAGNVLSIRNKEGHAYLAMSAKAFSALTESQIQSLQKYTTVLPIQIPTIETIGGGSVRCMLAQNFLKIQ